MNKRTFPCLFAIFVDILGYGLVYPLAASMLAGSQAHILPAEASTHTHHFYLSLMYLLYPAAMFFGASFMGDLSDKFGRRKILTLCMAGISLSFCLMGFGALAPSLALLLLGRALSGIFAGSPPIAQAIMADISTSAQAKAKNLSLTVGAQCLGTICGPLIAGIFSNYEFSPWFTYATPFFVAAIFGVLAMVWVYFSLEYKVQKLRRHKFEPLRPILVFIEAFRDKRVRLLALTAVFGQIAFGTFFQMISVALRQSFHYKASLIGYFYAFMGIFFITSIYIVPKIHKWARSPEYLAMVGFLCNAVAVSFFFFQVSEVWVWVLTAILCLTNPFYYTGLMMSLSNAVAKDRQGWVMGIYGATIAFGWIISGLSPNLLNWLSAWTVISFGAITFAVTAFILRLYIYHRPKAK